MEERQMTEKETKKALQLLSNLFPETTITADQSQLTGGHLQKCSSYAAAERAINEHRESHTFIDWPQLYEGIRAAENRRRASREFAGSMSIIDVWREANPRFQNCSDFEVILVTYWMQWRRLLKRSVDADQRVKDKQSETIHCREKLIHSGMTGEDAEIWTKTIFEPEGYFRMALEELRANHPHGRPIVAGDSIVEIARRRFGADDPHKPDTVCVLEHFVDAWQTAQKCCLSDSIREDARSRIYARCASVLRNDLELSPEESIEFARQVIELQPGEQLKRPANLTFDKMVLRPPDSPAEQLRSLAVAHR